MKTTYVVILSVLLPLVSACAQKVNDPADVQAIKTLLAGFDAGFKAGKPDAAVTGYYTDDAVRMDANQPAVTGKDSIRALAQRICDQYAGEWRNVAEDVRVSGDLAAVRGSYTGAITPKAGGSALSDKGQWVEAAPFLLRTKSHLARKNWPCCSSNVSGVTLS